KAFLLNLKANGFRVTIASHRSSESREQTERWLQRHGLVYDELHLSFDKTCLFNGSTDVVVDDAPHVLERARARSMIATGLRFPWNEGCVRSGFSLFDSLDEVLGHILRR
ncbi:MAG: 5' nucleotidase, NT5C type, partial [Thermodesulfovibrionales bacterium]